VAVGRGRGLDGPGHTAIAFTLWSWVLRHLDAGRAALINNLMLPEIAVLGWLLLGEAPTTRDTVGLLIVLAGTVAAHAGRLVPGARCGARATTSDG
jgi:drug/metabolite transporter (DMT)-like permease